jgi:hypothetical protein
MGATKKNETNDGAGWLKKIALPAWDAQSQLSKHHVLAPGNVGFVFEFREPAKIPMGGAWFGVEVAASDF